MALFEKVVSGRDPASAAPSAAPMAAASPGSPYEGADRMNLELARWNPPLLSADAEILDSKDTLDARGREVARNDPLISNAVEMYKDGVVGTKFVLNSKPDGRFLGWDDQTVEEVQEEIESLFEVYAHSSRCHLDASRKMDLTDIIRMGTGSYITTGEFLATFEWMPDRPFSTVVQVIDPDRLSNPDFAMDTYGLRRGVERDGCGQPIAYHIRTSHPSDFWQGGDGLGRWKRVAAHKPWGRPMVLHVYDPLRADQTRGIARIVSVLRQTKMTSRFSDVALQNAVIQATIAAVIESEKYPDELYAQLAGDPGADMTSVHRAHALGHLNSVLDFERSGNVARLNNARIPHLYPGTKLNIQALGDGTLGTQFESSLIRKIAAGLGVSAEELSKNLSETSFAGVKAAMAQTFQAYKSVKRTIADRIANGIYQNWLEEVVNSRELTTLPASARVPGWVYSNRGRVLDALATATWIGASKGTIDEYNEMRAAKMRLELGITTKEYESARLGHDWRDVQKQLRREARYLGGPAAINPAPASGATAAIDYTEDRLAAVEEFVERTQNDA